MRISLTNVAKAAVLTTLLAGAATPAAGAHVSADTVTAKIAAGWAAKPIGAGIKPALALDRKGKPAVAYLREALNGSVSYAAAADGWRPQTVVSGYFYGPIGLAFDGQSRPNIAYHDHQGQQVDLNRGGLAYAVRNGARWAVSSAAHPGHDGWDSTIAIGRDGIVRAAGILPSQFNSQEGVDYYELRGGKWRVIPIGSGPVAYEFNVSLAVDPRSGRPALTYYNDQSADLVFASFDGKRWARETVVAKGDVGKFSSLQFDARGRPHISFFQERSGSSGTIRYATKTNGKWTIEDVGTLSAYEGGMIGARRNSSLALDAKGVPHIAYSDKSVLRLATRTASGWKSDPVATATKRPLGQLVSLALDRGGRPHLSFFEVTGASGMLEGEIVYVTKK